MPFSRVLLALAAAAAATACASTEIVGPEGDRRFYEARCGVCHVAYAKDEHPSAQWSSILDVMGPRAGLTRAQRERVLRYLTDAPVAVGDRAALTR